MAIKTWLEDRSQQLMQILRYQFHQYWSSADYHPSTIELYQISPTLFSLWLVQLEDDELWPARDKRKLLPGVTKKDARTFEAILADELEARRLLVFIERCWPLITTTASGAAGITVTGTEVHYIVQMQVAGQEKASEIRIEMRLSAESYGEMQEPNLLQIWRSSLQNAAGTLLHDRLRGLAQCVKPAASLEGVSDMAVPRSVPLTTRVPGQDPFEFQPQTRRDPADEELAVEVIALLEQIKKQSEELAALQKDVDVLKQHAGLL